MLFETRKRVDKDTADWHSSFFALKVPYSSEQRLYVRERPAAVMNIIS
jgi:hypothetical protein